MVEIPEEVGRSIRDLMREMGVFINPSKLEVIRKTKSGLNIYTENYVLIYNRDKRKLLIRSNHYLEPRERSKPKSREETKPENEGKGWW